MQVKNEIEQISAEARGEGGDLVARNGGHDEIRPKPPKFHEIMEVPPNTKIRRKNGSSNFDKLQEVITLQSL